MGFALVVFPWVGLIVLALCYRKWMQTSAIPAYSIHMLPSFKSNLAVLCGVRFCAHIGVHSASMRRSRVWFDIDHLGQHSGTPGVAALLQRVVHFPGR